MTRIPFYVGQILGPDGGAVTHVILEMLKGQKSGGNTASYSSLQDLDQAVCEKNLLLKTLQFPSTEAASAFQAELCQLPPQQKLALLQILTNSVDKTKAREKV